MFFLYYNQREKQLILTDIKSNERGLELLETNQSVESLVVRSAMYIKTYRCELDNRVEQQVNKRVVNKIKNKNAEKFRHTEESKQKISEGVSGENNGRYGVVDPNHIKMSKSEKLKFYYKYNVHGKKGYKDSEKTRKQKSLNNCNKGGWIWICNRSTGEERRCKGDIPEGWTRGRLHNHGPSLKRYNASRTRS
jgi:hypothetical protein